MAGRTRFPAPGWRWLGTRRRQRAGRGRRLRALPEGNTASGRHKPRRNDNRPRSVHPAPVLPIIPNLWVTRYHFSGVNGLILFSTHLDPGANPCFLGLNAFTIRIARKVPYDAYPQSHFSGGRAWDPLFAGDQGYAQGNAAGRRSPVDPARSG